MIKKSKINIFLIMTLITSSLIATLPSLNSQVSIEQNLLNSGVDTSMANSRAVYSEIDDISATTKLASSNMTWPDDVYSSTSGYNFLEKTIRPTETKDKKTVYTIDARGFTINTAYPSYSASNQEQIYDGGGTRTFPYPTLTTNLLIDGPTYDAGKNVLSASRRISSISMTLGGSASNNNFRNGSPVSLSRTQPFLKIQAPLVSHRLERWFVQTWIGPECVFYDNQIIYYAAAHFTSVKSLAEYAGESQPSVSLVSPHYDGLGNLTNSNLGSPHYHTSIVTENASLMIYNDYNTSGTLLATYLSNTTKGFDSVLPKLIIDEKLFDKTKTVLEQNFTQTNLVKIIDGQSIPSMGGYSLTAEKIPFTETIVFTYKPKFVFSNGLLVEYSGPGVSTRVTGFSKLRTIITPLNDYNHNIVVDRFVKYVTNGGVINSDILGTFLDLSSVPPDVTYEIISPVPDLIAGILKFKITASDGYSEGNTLLGRKTPNYNITMQLAPRITKIGYTSFLDDILVTEYYGKVFNEDGSIKLDEFNKYNYIIAPVDNAQYFLVPGSYKVKEADGNVDFKLYATTYYDTNAQEKNGTAAGTATHFKVSLVVNPHPSSVTVKEDYVPTHRADKFIGLISNADGNITDLDLLKQYVDIEYIPTSATYAVDPASVTHDAYNDDFYYEYVNFDLVISKYNETSKNNETSFATPAAKTISLRLKLNAVHLETEVLAKMVAIPERVDRLLPRLMNDQGMVTDRSLLEQYVDIKALPKRSVLSIDNVQMNNQLGKLNFDLKASVAYGNDSNELLDAKYPVELQLGIKHIPTTVTPVVNISNPERVDRFAQQLATLDSNGLKNYLVPQYLNIDGEFPIAENTLTYAIAKLTYQDVGTVNFDFIISSVYDNESDPQNNYSFPISLNLTQKFAPTNISVYSDYPRGSTVEGFKQLYAKSKDNQIDLKKFLGRFLKGIDTIPANAITTINIDDDKTDPLTGKVVFNVQTSTYYDADSDLIDNPGRPYDSAYFQLNLAPQDQQATLTTTADWKNGISIGGKAADFYALVNPNNKINFEELSYYLTLNNIPIDAEISVENKDPDFKSPLLLSFDLVLTQWWETGNLKPQNGDEIQVKRIAFQKSLYVIDTNTKSLSFQWWWIALGIAGLVLLATTYFLAKQYKEEQSFKQRALAE